MISILMLLVIFNSRAYLKTVNLRYIIISRPSSYECIMYHQKQMGKGRAKVCTIYQRQATVFRRMIHLIASRAKYFCIMIGRCIRDPNWQNCCVLTTKIWTSAKYFLLVFL
uniref:Secreted protein n=1 Tax=Babesia bovis TaxID=5865 RepID=S6BMA3_BABBO|nr:hypothetical protein [Babesia bovis]